MIGKRNNYKLISVLYFMAMKMWSSMTRIMLLLGNSHY